MNEHTCIAGGEPWCSVCHPRFILTDDERADLRIILARFRIFDATPEDVEEHVTELASAYHSQGYVMGDLAHDGTLKAQAEAEEQ